MVTFQYRVLKSLLWVISRTIAIPAHAIIRLTESLEYRVTRLDWRVNPRVYPIYRSTKEVFLDNRELYPNIISPNEDTNLIPS